MVRAFPIHQFPVCIKSLTPEAVFPLVFTKIDIPLIVNPLQHQLNNGNMFFIRGPDKETIIDIQLRPKVPEKVTDLIHIFFRAERLLLGGTDDFIPMLIGAGEKIGIQPFYGIETTGHISQNGGICMPKVRPCIHIIYRGGDIERFNHLCTYSYVLTSSRDNSISVPSSMRTTTSFFRTLCLKIFPIPFCVVTAFPIFGKLSFNS